MWCVAQRDISRDGPTVFWVGWRTDKARTNMKQLLCSQTSGCLISENSTHRRPNKIFKMAAVIFLSDRGTHFNTRCHSCLRLLQWRTKRSGLGERMLRICRAYIDFTSAPGTKMLWQCNVIWLKIISPCHMIWAHIECILGSGLNLWKTVIKVTEKNCLVWRNCAVIFGHWDPEC